MKLATQSSRISKSKDRRMPLEQNKSLSSIRWRTFKFLTSNRIESAKTQTLDRRRLE
jgi:hypothetical protein